MSHRVVEFADDRSDRSDRYRVVGLDLGAACGFAWTDRGQTEPAHVGVWDLRHPAQGRGSIWSTEHPGDVYAALWNHLEDLGPNVVAFELCRGHRGTSAAQNWGAWAGVLLCWCALHGIEYRGIHTAKIKKHATKKGNAKKAVMLEAAKWRLGYEGQEENEVDALWTLDAFLAGVE
jgi:Holliday junction resolvasome RuvABC endonuclease subunit